jgi:hypothetical protein
MNSPGAGFEITALRGPFCESEPHAMRWWAEFARMDRTEFEKQAADLVRPQGALAVLRELVAPGGGV